MTIEIDGSKIFCKIIGDGMPILFIHGWGIDHRIWVREIEASLGKRKRSYRRIYFDLPGMGKSVAAESIHNSDGMTDAIEKFANAVIPDGPFLLAGLSYGGYLARGLLLRMSARVAGLLLVCPLVFPGYRKGRVPPHVVLERDGAYLARLSAADRESFDYLAVIQTKETHRDYLADVHLGIIKENEGFLAHRPVRIECQVSQLDDGLFLSLRLIPED